MADKRRYLCTFACGKGGTKEEMHQIKVFGRLKYACPSCVDKAWKPEQPKKGAVGDDVWKGIPTEYRQELPIE